MMQRGCALEAGLVGREAGNAWEGATKTATSQTKEGTTLNRYLATTTTTTRAAFRHMQQP